VRQESGENYSVSCVLLDEIKKDEMGGNCGTRGVEKKLIHCFRGT
jgi:hypothetical protein